MALNYPIEKKAGWYDKGGGVFLAKEFFKESLPFYEVTYAQDRVVIIEHNRW